MDPVSDNFASVRSISGVTSQAEPTAPPVPGGGRGRWAWVVGTLLAAAVLMFCYLRIAGTTQVNSDGAGLAWEASDILHGNVLLHGWWATDVSFYTTELPEYVIVTAFAGLRPEVVHICSALTYTLLVLLAAFVARGRARGALGVVRALVAAGVVLAPQPTGPTQVLLGSPDHVGTGVPVLLLLLLLEWAPARRWYVPVGAGVLLAWSIVGDPLIEVVGVLPLFLACLIRAARILWRWRAAGPPPAGQARPLRSRARGAWSAAWYELSLAAAAAAAVPAAKLANHILVHLGGIRTASAWYGHLLPLYQIRRELPLAWQSTLTLFGADHAAVHGTGNIVFARLHFIGVFAVIIAIAVAAWHLLRPRATLAPAGSLSGGAAAPPGDLIADILLLAIAANFAAFLTVVPIQNIYSAHEIGPVLSLGAALAGRALGDPIVAGWRRGRRTPHKQAAGEPVRRSSWLGRWPSRPGRLLLPVAAAILACYAMMLGIATTHTQAAPRNVGLAGWLARHHLTSGLAPYWEASSVTVDSGGAITVLSVEPHAGHLVPRHWQNDVLLADPAGHTANFVIISPAENVRRSDAIATFGKPADSYRWGPYTILVWHENLLPMLSKPAAKSRSGTLT